LVKDGLLFLKFILKIGDNFLENKIKICIKCGIEKSLSDYYFRKDSNSYRNECKICCLNKNKDYHKNHKEELKVKSKKYRIFIKESQPWYSHYTAARARCNNVNSKDYKNYGLKGIQFLLTKKECECLWNRDSGWLLKEPSIDRIDNDGDYTFDNCQFIEKHENSLKRHLPVKQILQYDLDGNFIKEWESILSASKFINRHPTSIEDALHNRSRTCANFIWKYKKEVVI
jgi:hypothetical protein